MSIPLFSAIAQSERLVQELFDICDDKISIGMDHCLISSDGDIVFGHNRPVSMKEASILVDKFFGGIDQSKHELEKMERKLKTMLNEVDKLQRYVKEKDKTPFRETCEKAVKTRTNLSNLIEALNELNRHRDKGIFFYSNEAQRHHLKIFDNLLSVLGQYKGKGRTVKPIEISVNIEVMDIR